MKTILLGLLSSFLILSGANGQSNWEIVNEGFVLIIWDFEMTNADTAWIIDTEKGLLKTNDGGNTWQTVLETEPFYFYGIDFIDDLTGWILKGGFDIDSLQIHKTMDGGQTWFHQKSVNRGDFFSDKIYAVNDSIVYVLAVSLLKTTDGGTSWGDVTPPESPELTMGSFLNADTGIVKVRNDNGVTTLFRTFNGGADWDEITMPEFGEIYAIKFLNDSLGYFRGREYNSMNRLYKTTDAFNSWVAITDEKYYIHAFHFFDDDLVLSVMEDSKGTNLMKSEDGGLSWEHWGDSKLPAYRDFQFHFFENVGYLICKGTLGYNEGCLILRTVNQGKSWEMLNFSYPLRDVFFMDETKGYLAGGTQNPHSFTGSLIRTNDGFKTFDFPLGGAGGALGGPFYIYRSCHFINDSVGFYTDGTLMKTSDGGESWIRDYTLDYNEAVDICFINNSTAYAITHDGFFWGDYGNEIYQTTNGAESWNKVYTIEVEDYFLEQLYSVFFIDENSGWVVGWSGENFSNYSSDDRPKIQKYDDEQGWREIPTDADLPLNKIYFVDHDHGWILGGYSNRWEHHPLLLKSEDGGENWSEVKGMDYFINEIYFETVDHGWSVGGDSTGRGVILETFDGGENWEVAIDSLSGSLHALHMQNGHGWAVGDNGLILKTEYTSTIGTGQDYFVEGESENLFWNYPNPFQSQTMISYQLPSSAEVELNIYDLTGRKIATLMKERQAAGNYEVEWNASGRQPVIYFCELRTQKRKQVIKMVLIE